ncbi:MAG: HAD family hydrolase [Myxococcota bacterium]
MDASGDEGAVWRGDEDGVDNVPHRREDSGRPAAGGGAMSIKCVVLDFDGTFTDVEKEAGPFVDVFQRDIADLVGRDITAAWQRLTALVQAEPESHGWEYGGKIVAPANADPYVRCTCVAQLLFTELGLLKNAETRSVVTQAVYQKAYKLTLTAFRPDASEVLRTILARKLPTFVVTNARTDMVLRKLKELGFENTPGLQVFGEAHKFVITEAETHDPRFQALPQERRVDGLTARPVFVRRGRYFDVLSKVWQLSGASPSETLVCGDIFELDLAMPAELGAHVQLVGRPDTARYEKNAVAALGSRGGFSEHLSAVLERLPR